MSESKTALVLSAGGMFGAYQAGAWKALAGVFRPDMVVGTSAGAINGWAIAGGQTPEELIARWLEPRTATLMQRRFTPRPWNGCFNPKPLEESTKEMLESIKPQIPFAGTIVEIPKMRLRLVRAEEMDWRHLMAMCAVPFGYPPVRIEGKRYVDGGLLGVLPLWAAERMGARRAVAVNALPLMPSAVVRHAAALARRFAREVPSARNLQTVEIKPSEPLGNLRDAMKWDEGRIRALIERGENDARAMLPAVLRLIEADNFV